jgi:eukaryotic-like serine/threonine-protein kinase
VTATKIDERSAETMLPRDAEAPTQATGLPPALLAQSARRLRILALQYAFVFFMSDPLLAILFPEQRVTFLSSPMRWAPSVVSISTALLLVLLTYKRGISVVTILEVGLIFEVVGSFGIAAAQYLDPSRYAEGPPWLGLSWVAVWMIGFTVVVPSQPRRALAAALASASAVPVTVAVAMAAGLAPIRVPPVLFFFALVLPYLLVVLVAYVGARIVYHLGTELNRAQELGSYRLVERLGQGGMGEVWRARHRLLARPAAIKLMRPEVLGGSSFERRSELHARFEREAQATASLRSPHTIELYDFGVADNGEFYYVMEFLDGYDLETLVQQFGPVSPARAIHLLRQVCQSIGEAHSVGLIHRDIKPANIYVCRYGRELDFVKVLDFGLVKSHADESATNLSLTRDNLAGGTPAFMAPEQVLGDTPIDRRTDIYALGCVAYWLVTGQLVFSGRTAMETMLHHTRTNPVPPSERTGLDIPDALDRWILACLEKSPDDRPATVDAAAERLLAIKTAGTWTPDEMRKWWDQHHPSRPADSAPRHEDTSHAITRTVAVND